MPVYMRQPYLNIRVCAATYTDALWMEREDTGDDGGAATKGHRPRDGDGPGTYTLPPESHFELRHVHRVLGHTSQNDAGAVCFNSTLSWFFLSQITL